MATTFIETNEFQTPITQELVDSLSPWVKERFLDFIDNVPLINYMISPNRPRAKDLPRDDDGKIIVDIAHPHILEDVDYFRPAAKFFEENGCYTFLKPNPNPRSEYGKWITEEARRCREGYVRESDGEWVTGFMYWYLNYCRIKLTKVNPKTGVASQVPDFPLFWEGVYYRFHYIHQARIAHKHGIELARRGAHPYSQKAYTPDGVKDWGEIKIGDRLFGTHGNITTVVDIPFDDIADVYKFTLRDGRVVYASDDHIWNVIRKNGKVVQRTTKELLQNYALTRPKSWRIPSGIEYQYFIPGNDGVDYYEQELPIDPYTMGIILGDGCFRIPNYRNQVTIAGMRDDISHYASEIPYEIKKVTSDDRTWSIRLDISYLHDVGLWMKKSEEKFIPDIYRYNSRHNRLRLLQGLFDTDGFGSGRTRAPQISTSSKMLADNIMEVARSLGYNCTFIVKKSGYKKDGLFKRCLDSYIVTVYAGNEIFTLPRKKALINSLSSESRKRKTCIVDIEYVGREKCKCVTVDADDSSYLIGDFVQTHNCGKSYSIAGMMSHNLVLGENEFSKNEVTTILAAYLKEYLSDKDGTLNKFVKMKDFVSKNTEFPRLLAVNRPSDMLWIAGTKDNNGTITGSNNSVMGVAVKDDEAKVRGKRGFIFFEEMGSFKNLLATYNNTRDSVKDGEEVFAEIYLVGTAGDKDSDFSGAKDILYDPDSYEIYALPNVYDLNGKGRDKFGYFFPSYISRTGCMDKDGNSDVVKSLIAILNDRDNVRRSKPETLLSVIAQRPITPEEAIIRVRKGYFPTDMINERLRQIDQNPRFYDSMYVGTLVEVGSKVEFKATDDIPIREWPIKKNDNRYSLHGALEIFRMPPEGDIPPNRYVLGIDPIENDEDANSESLFAMEMFDLFNDEIVAEYCGRMELNNDNCYLAWLLCRFYNAKCMPESNKKNVYAYFAKKHSIYMLADCPEYLKQKDIIKYSTTGSSSKGVQALPAVISFAQDMIKDWLMEESTQHYEGKNGQLQTESIPGVYKVWSRGLLKELLSYGPGANTDRVSALMQVMLYRHQFQILYGEHGENVSGGGTDDADDEFFNIGWDKYSKTSDNTISV